MRPPLSDQAKRDRYPVGTLIRHHGGSLWKVVEYIGGRHGDRRIECVEGTAREGYVGGEVEGARIVVHDEYIPRSFRIEPSADEKRKQAVGTLMVGLSRAVDHANAARLDDDEIDLAMTYLRQIAEGIGARTFAFGKEQEQ